MKLNIHDHLTGGCMRSLMTAVLMLIVFSIGVSTTHRVPQDFATVQLAINAADNGDTVLVAEGTYVENLFVNKNIVLGSLFLTDGDTSHISKTIIDGSGSTNPDSGATITLGAVPDTTLEIIGFTITKGKGNKSWDYLSVVYWMAGGGIESGVGGSARIAYNRIVKNSCVTTGTVDSIYGGGIGISNPTNSVRPYIIIEHNTIGDNTVNGYITEAGGIGLYFMSGRIMNNIIENNSNTSSSSYCKGGGLCIGITTPLTIAHNIIRNNTAQGSGSNGDGGGLSVYGNATLGTTNIALHNNIFVGNTTYRGGAIFVLTRTTINAVNNTFYDNNATLGSAVRVAQYTTGIVRLMNNIFANNNPNDQVSTTGGYIYAHNNIIHGQSFGSFNYNVSPQFIPSDPLCRLSVHSPAIAKGVNVASVGGQVLDAPATDIAGNPRPNPSWSRCDLGATETEFAFPGALHTYRVPDDFATIRQVINAAADSDVVLISEGTYQENLLINKKITLASLYYMDNDTSHISKTIIDGSLPSHPDSGATITCVPGTDTTTVITGLTITGGKGNKHVYNPPTFWIEGGGIDVMSGGATIRHNIIRNNALISFGDSLASAGVSVVTLDPNLGISHVIIEDNLLTDNSLTSVYGEGGGIGIYDSKARIMRNKILNNIVTHTGGIFAYNKTVSDTVFIEQNLVQGNHASVNIGGIVFSGPSAVGMIRNNTVIDNTANAISGIAIGWSAYAIVDRNYIARNVATNGLTGGVYLFQTLQKSIICNNIIAENTGAGIHTNNSSSAIAINNTIVNNNAYGLKNSSGSLYAMNNIVKNSGTEINGTVYASYNMIEGGYSGTLNINADPLFVPGDTLYKLSTGSPCLGKGRLTATVGGVVLNAPATDYSGVTRPLPASTWPDLGASESIFTDDVKDAGPEIPTEFALTQNYPNPFNPSTTIRYALPASENVKLTVHDLLGREIAVLVDEIQHAGLKEVEWNAFQVSSGIYFFKVQAGNFTETKKMSLIK